MSTAERIEKDYLDAYKAKDQGAPGHPASVEDCGKKSAG